MRAQSKPMGKIQSNSIMAKGLSVVVAEEEVVIVPEMMVNIRVKRDQISSIENSTKKEIAETNDLIEEVAINTLKRTRKLQFNTLMS